MPLWDDIDELWDLAGGGSVRPSGTYIFGDIDLGSVFTSRVTVVPEVTQVSLSDIFDLLAGDWDSQLRLWDGGTTGDTDVAFEVATTDDDPAGSPAAAWSAYRAFVVGDYTARAFRFRATLSTRISHLTPVLAGVTVLVDMPDRVASARALVSAADGSFTVSFAPPFRETPAFGITMNDAASGDRWVFSAKSPSAISGTFRNSAGAGVQRNYDWFARGYGREAS